LNPDGISINVEEIAVNDIKQLLQDVRGHKFHILMKFLRCTRLGCTIRGHEELVDIVANEAKLDQTFGPTESDSVAGDFGALTGLASPCPGAAILLYAWPHETLCHQLRCCFGAWLQQIMDGLEHLES
jgi:hypothetical protein